jgi:general L-amino acid transport system permease protein
MNDLSKPAHADKIKPPSTEVGVIGWVRHNLFNGVFNSIATIVILAGLIRVVPQFIQWAFIDSVWLTSGQQCHEAEGACWSVVTQNIRFNIFGYYPYDGTVAAAAGHDHPDSHAALQPGLEQVE